VNVGTVTLRAGHVQPVWAGHPWVFAQAVERIEGGVEAGGEVIVRDVRGNALGRGLYSPGSAIPVRIYTRDPNQPVDARFFEQRLLAAVARRNDLGLHGEDTNGLRLVHAEGDDLPGLIVDQLGDCLAIQIGTVGIKQREALVLDALERTLRPRAIVDRTSSRTAANEGFAPGTGVLRGDASVTAFEFRERGMSFRIPLALGQKTGFYFDQRPLRARVEALAKGRQVLDVYSYTGAIALFAARGGAREVEAVDTSALALEVGAECASQNRLDSIVRFERGDAFEALARAGREGGRDLVICDPPKLAQARGKRQRALEAMRKLAAAGSRATRPGGLLVICSCSAAIGLPELTRAVALGARDVGLRAIILERLFQGPDHPVPSAFPEGLYLSTLLLQIVPS
jgi:23S rRNA (cytosine1962-C5)-methyltransferase